MGENVGMRGFRVLPLGDEAIAPALRLVKTVFDEFEAPFYAQEGVEEFDRFLAADNIASMRQNQRLLFWGAYEKDTLVGVITTRSASHICLLFVDKAYHRRGIARQLFSAVLEDCGAYAQSSGEIIAAITVNSSPYAVAAYEHLGFVPVKDEQTLNGIRFTPMVYSCSD